MKYLDVGTWVKVEKEIKFVYENNKKVMKEVILKTPKFGKICGKTTKYTGEWEVEYFVEDETRSYFVQDKSFNVYEVKYGLMNKPVFVRIEDVIIPFSYEGIFLENLPYKFSEEKLNILKGKIEEYRKNNLTTIYDALNKVDIKLETKVVECEEKELKVGWIVEEADVDEVEISEDMEQDMTRNLIELAEKTRNGCDYNEKRL